MPSGADNVLTIHTTDGTERLRIDSSGNVKVGSAATISQDGDVFFTGVCTATTLSGAASGLTGALPAISAANLTNIPAANVTGTLPAISAANLTNVPAANVVGVHTSLNITGSTTTGTAVVGGGVTISESGIEASGIGITCANINGTQIGGRRNIIINGAMQVAQHGTSTSTSGQYTADRFKFSFGGTDESPTMTQHTLSTSDTPYSLGFKKSLKITNGNQTSGAGAADFLEFYQYLEDQDISNSGWNFKSDTSFITLSFWVKSSVAQKFTGFLYTNQAGEGDSYMYSYPIGSNGGGGNLTADTWTKFTHSIPGNSNLTFNNDNTRGLALGFFLFEGTDYSTSSHTENTWAAWSNSNKIKDMTSTWYTTNDATFEITGVQLEVGSQATAFEHRSFAEELLLCQRYFYKLTTRTDDNCILGQGMYYGDTQIRCPVRSHVEMRSAPTVETTNSTGHFRAYAKGSGVAFPTFDSSHQDHKGGIVLGATIDNNSHNGAGAYIVSYYDASTGVGVVSLNAEL